MSKFLEILKVALSDKKYGWYEPKEVVVKSRLSEKRGYYGNEDCLKQWWDRERKEYN